MVGVHVLREDSSDTSVIGENHVSAFLAVNSPCCVHFSTELRDAAREFLQRQLDGGDLTQDHLAEYQRAAGLLSFLED